MPENPSRQWVMNTLTKQGIEALAAPESVRDTPWSKVSRLLTVKGYVYLKEMSPQFAVEPYVLNLLHKELSANVTEVIAHDDVHRWFLMPDAGSRLREKLKQNYQVELVASMLKEYAELQIKAVNKNEKFLALRVKDWRLVNLPSIYEALLSQRDFLQRDGLTEADLATLASLKGVFAEKCEQLAQLGLPETIEHGDFQDNNILIDKNDKITFNDWGDANITHPFFSLGSWLDSASRHHQMGVNDPRRAVLMEAYLEPWQAFAPLKILKEAFIISETIRPVLFAINFCRVASCPGMENLGEFKGYIAGALKEFMQENH
ncbi:MAG: aminoglycoside phosphotransferase family protein [Candidatus Berkiella sp.]